METWLLLSPLLLTWLALPVSALAGRFRAAWAPWTGALLSLLAFVGGFLGWQVDAGVFLASWVPSWNVNLAFALDGAAALYTLLATGIGTLILVYSQGYLPHHLSGEQHAGGRSVRFCVLIMFFMGSMIGLVMAQDLLLLFVFWELTTIASYLLIGFDSYKKESRRAALMALLVTGITSLLFLIGALLLYSQYGTFLIPDLLRITESGPLFHLALALIAVAALAKSAQVPFHFWLPRAMAAPTPVSAYLHSAAMVAAGVFLLSRLHLLLHKSPLLLDALLGVGLLSMLMGSFFALQEVILKRILAYSTIAQYGYVVFLLGLGTSGAVLGATLYVLAHALMKSALFLTAGAVTQATNEDRLSVLGGLARQMPWLAAGSGIAAAGLSGLPLTLGFFKDEMLFKAAFERSNWLAVIAVVNAGLTLAYAWRWWNGIFIGDLGTAVEHIPRTMLAPVMVLASLILLGGVWGTPFAQLAGAAAATVSGAPAGVDLVYHLDARPENIMAICVYLVGVLLIVRRPTLQPLLNGIVRAGDSAGPERSYTLAGRGLEGGSAFLYNFELHDLANRIATVLIPTATLLFLGLWLTPSLGLYQAGEIGQQDLPLTLALLLTAASAILVAIPRDHLTQVLVVSSVNYGLAGVFAFLGAPNLALVVVLVGVVSTLIYVAVFTLLPLESLQQAESLSIPVRRTGRDLFVSTVAGGIAFLVAWGVLSQPSFEESVGSKYVELAPAAHARDVVTAILADWRGLDTMGEVTVLAVILVGVGSYLRVWRQR